MRVELLSSSLRSGRRSAARGLAVTAFCLALLGLSARVSAQPVFEGVQTNKTSGNSTGLSVSVPAGVAAGDLLIAVWGVAINPLTSVPSGFTAVPGFEGFNQATCPLPNILCQLSVSYKIAAGTETSVNFSFSGAPGGPRAQIAAVLRYSNVNTSDPIGPAAENSGTGSPVTAPAIVTTEANNLILRIGLAGDETNSVPPALGTGPADARFNDVAGGNSDAAVSLAAADIAQALAGNTGTATWTSGSDEWTAGTIAIRPASQPVDADLSIDKDDGETKVNPGDTITYTIVAANSALGNDVVGASVDDLFPSDLSCTWTCTASAGSACTAGPVVGDIVDSVDLLAGGTATYSAVCDVSLLASGTILNTATITAPDGVTDTDGANNDDSDTTTINQPPVALCADAFVTADSQCQANASIDAGSNDPDGDNPISLLQSPAGPYPLGATLVTLTVTDALGLSDSCQATVTVLDETDPVIMCNAPPTIVPPDAPISFTASASDNCSVASVEITEFTCTKELKNGKVIDKTESCIVSLSGDTINIDDVGGVNTIIGWTVEASDGSGNTASKTCSVVVENPGKN